MAPSLIPPLSLSPVSSNSRIPLSAAHTSARCSLLHPPAALLSHRVFCIPGHSAGVILPRGPASFRSEEHTSELRHSQISYAVFCLKKKKKKRVIRHIAPKTQHYS